MSADLASTLRFCLALAAIACAICAIAILYDGARFYGSQRDAVRVAEAQRLAIFWVLVAILLRLLSP